MIVHRLDREWICTMSPEFSLDVLYRTNPQIVSSFKSPDSMAVLGPGIAMELSLSLLQVVMAFAEAKSARQAYQALDADTDVDLEQFGTIVRHLCERGVLVPVADGENELDLAQMLNPRIFGDAARLEKLGGWMRQGRAIVIPDALPGELAEEIHRDLDRSTRWTVAEGGRDFFHFRNSVIGRIDGLSGALTRCSRLFTRAFRRRDLEAGLLRRSTRRGELVPALRICAAARRHRRRHAALGGLHLVSDEGLAARVGRRTVLVSDRTVCQSRIQCPGDVLRVAVEHALRLSGIGGRDREAPHDQRLLAPHGAPCSPGPSGAGRAGVSAGVWRARPRRGGRGADARAVTQLAAFDDASPLSAVTTLSIAFLASPNSILVTGL
jgi:hypothetical protein